MTEKRTPRKIALRMEPLIRDLRNGADAVVAVAGSDHYGHIEPNGILYIAEALGRDAEQLKELWCELCTVTEGDVTRPPLKAVDE